MDSIVLALLVLMLLALIGKFLYKIAEKFTPNNKIRLSIALIPAILFIFWIANGVMSERNLADDLYSQGRCDTHRECGQIAGEILRGRGN